MPLPVLFSLRRCPYCMRARMGLLLAKQPVMLREVVMNALPMEMLSASPKGTVPVLQFDDSSVIDESLNIMIWALHQNDPNNVLCHEQPDLFPIMLNLINRNDNEFTVSLEKYKAASRYHDIDEVHYRQQCEIFIFHIEQQLIKHHYLMGTRPSLADYALLPFIRQFSRVDRKWYLTAPYPNLKRWLIKQYENPLYSKSMRKDLPWIKNHHAYLFGDE